MSYKILFFGTPEFGRTVLKDLHGAKHSLVGVVAQPDRPAGRGQELTSPPCALYAKEKGLALFQPETLKDEEVIAALKALSPDFIVSAAYGLFLPKEILELPRIDVLNVHPSLLPLYRGAAPIQWALLDGQKETGVTIMRTTAKMDSGPVYAQSRIRIEPADNSATLHDKLAEEGGRLLLEALPRIAQGELKPVEQDEAGVKLAPLIAKTDGRIRWAEPAPQIWNRIRAFTPWPGAHTQIDKKLLKIYDAAVLPEKTTHAPGEIYMVSPQGLHVACGDSSLCLLSVQLEGKKRMPAFEFAKGYRLDAGKRFS